MDNGQLDVMLDLYPGEGERNAIRQAYSNLAEGDPNTFPVQFAVLLAAHTQALKVYHRPDLDIQKAQVGVSRLINAVNKLTERCDDVAQTMDIVAGLSAKQLRWWLAAAYIAGVVTLPLFNALWLIIKDTFHF